MTLDIAKLNEIAQNLGDLGTLLGKRRTSADPELWRELGAAFGGISEAISELTAAAPAQRAGAGCAQGLAPGAVHADRQESS
ncbi:hypothetical protein [Pseudoclavibacter sp. AY1H1]|uniref:hypothetical protein n=1 Tax=Pseudoclavibacter sp. AY1H1 TaxID=2080584 RepID=UPI000CE770A0|nr:hypothetical protein [Pseudoclavibacter sp. AY1H1]PPF32671.1 hypothetical protein C5E05_19395 [Pseudoclavibacter sp. AY1H1]